MAELTLAIVPLVISAVEHYSDVSKAISRYRHFSDHIDEFFSELDVQCRIFQTSLQLLLASAVGDDQATRMLRDENDGGWTDSDLDVYMSERFPGHTASAVKSCLDLIERQLVKLLETCKSFQLIAETVEQVRVAISLSAVGQADLAGWENILEEESAPYRQED